VLPFAYERATSVAQAVELGRSRPGLALLAGGTELLSWMRDGIVVPTALLDLAGLDLDRVAEDGDGALHLGALARLADVAAHPSVRRLAPCLAQAIESSASPQLRNMGTLGGNLLQRTRCPYFRAGPGVPCNQRAPGSGCPAREGDHRTAAILGASADCIATHPSDPAVALAALDAAVVIAGAGGERTVSLADFYRPPGPPGPPGRTPPGGGLERGDLIVAIRVPALPGADRSRYLKARDRAAFDFALVSCAAVVGVIDGRVSDVRVVLGGVAPAPWRCQVAEGLVRGKPAEPRVLRDALAAEMRAASPLQRNRFKVELAARLAVRTVLEAVG
jgi:xanthine dehydrogenase YagS FAD-binding subunit